MKMAISKMFNVLSTQCLSPHIHVYVPVHFTRRHTSSTLCQQLHLNASLLCNVLFEHYFVKRIIVCIFSFSYTLHLEPKRRQTKSSVVWFFVSFKEKTYLNILNFWFLCTCNVCIFFVFNFPDFHE